MSQNDATLRKSTLIAMPHNKRESSSTGSHSLNSPELLLKVARKSTCFRYNNNDNKTSGRSSSFNENSIVFSRIKLYKITLFCVVLLCLFKVISRNVLFAKSSSINGAEAPAINNAQSTASFATSQLEQEDRSRKVRILARSLITNSQQDSSKSQQNESNNKVEQQQNGRNSTKLASGCLQSIAGYSNFESSGIWNQNLASDQSIEYQNYSFGYTQSRVSNFVKPIFYTLRLKVDPTKRKFSGQLMITLDIDSPNEFPKTQSASLANTDIIKENSNAKNLSDTNRVKNGELGYRYLTLHAGRNINIKKAFYVFTAKSSVQIPATKIGKDAHNELLTIDFYPNIITSGQGLLLIVYTGNVNETDSHGLFVHHSQKAAKRFLMIKNGSTVELDDSGLATHMQPNFARRLFPAWDEPHLKARFSLIVILPFRNYQSISNMPIKRKSISLSCSGESLQEIEFQTTPTMSTYLLTLVIGRLDYIESMTPNNCKIRVYVYSNRTTESLLVNQQKQGPQQQLEQASGSGVNHRKQAAQIALEVAVETFDRFETLLGVKYPLRKFDMIALREFDNGGMENWGASIFHENYILYDNSTQSSATFSQDIQVNGRKSHRPRRLIVPLVVAHEIAHQWFGNLLTSHSWTYLWLNEGFAQLLMYDVANSLFPNENYWHIFLEDSRQSAMHEDELRSSTRALEFELDSTILEATGSEGRESSKNSAETNLPPAPSTSEQLNLFDQLTYNKGAMIVRMVYLLLGRKQFFSSLQHYLLKHSYDTVTSHDLWLALEESTGRADMQLESQMINWLRQEGYPVINVQVFEEPHHYRLLLAQDRFQLLNDSIDAPLLPKSKPWSIPISISSELCPNPSEDQLILRDIAKFHETNIMNSGNEEILSSNYQYCSFVNFLLAENQDVVLIPKVAVGSWFKLNFNAIGYFRVNYLNSFGSSSSSSSSSLVNDDSLLEQPASFENQINKQRENNRNNSDNLRRRQANLLPSQQPIDMSSRMASAVKDKSMCVIDRFNLVDDLFAMVKSGRKQTTYYLNYLIEAFVEETEIIVLRAIVESLRHIKLAIVSNSASNVNVLFNSTSTSTSTSTSASSDSDSKLMSHYERYVQKYLRKLSQKIMRSVESIRSEAALGKDASHQEELQLQLRELKESEDLIGAHRIQYNDVDMVKRATDLFSKHFRQQPTRQQQQQQQQLTAFDSMDRELRASIYSAALMGTNSNSNSGGIGSNNNEDSLDAPSNWALNDETLPATTLLRNSPPHVATRQLTRPDSSLHSSLSSIFAASSAPISSVLVPNSTPFSSSSPKLSDFQLPSSSDRLPSDVLSSIRGGPAQAPTDKSSASSSVPQAPALASTPYNNPGSISQQSFELQDSVFLKLLKAYETSDSSNERYAICTALGSVGQANKQIKLLNLTLFQNYFRPHDVISILDSMAKTKQGRKLIWEMLKANTKTLERRQLLGAILKSLSYGLIETTPLATTNKGQEQQHVETFLRSLYQSYDVEYGKLIGRTVEMMRINTQWFRRDHDSLVKYLISS